MGEDEIIYEGKKFNLDSKFLADKTRANERAKELRSFDQKAIVLYKGGYHLVYYHA